MPAVQTSGGRSKPPSNVARDTPSASGTLRELHTEQTRELILQTLAEQLAENGFEEFNIPRLARRARVSVRTVYRYFPARDALLDALARWLDDNIVAPSIPATVEGLESSPEGLFPAFDENETLILAQWATGLGRALRDRGRQRRLKQYRDILEEVTSGLPQDEARRALAVISYLLSSSTWKTMKEEFAMDGSESGAAVAWALRTLIADLRRRNRKSFATAKGED